MKITHSDFILQGALGENGFIECIQQNIGGHVFFIYLTKENVKIAEREKDWEWWHAVAKFKLKPKRTSVISDVLQVFNKH